MLLASRPLAVVGSMHVVEPPAHNQESPCPFVPVLDLPSSRVLSAGFVPALR